MRECACGCGQVIEPKPRHEKRMPQFVKGHHLRATERAPRYTPTPEEIPSGTCECGCGGKTEVAYETRRRHRWFIGHPRPFIAGHHARKSHGRYPNRGTIKFDALLSVPEAAYLAGILDGEGSIAIRERSFRVIIANTDTNLIAWLKSLGGIVKENPTPDNRRQVYRWAISERRAVENMLRQVLPFMIVKKDRAAAVLEMIDLLNSSHHDQVSTDSIPSLDI